jgi:hypothetical protein
MSGLRTLSSEDRKKVETFMLEGIKVLQNIEDQKGGLKDYTKTLAEEFSIAPAALTKALGTAFKNTLANKKEEMDLIEEILHVTGYN